MTPELRIVDACGTHERATVELLHRERLFERLGVRVRRSWVFNGAEAVELLLEGRADAAIQIGFGPALSAIAGGAPLRVVAGANLLSVHAIYSKAPAIRRLEDLRCRSVGVGKLGALTHQLITAALLRRGIDPSAVRFVTIGNSAAIFQALLAGEIEAGFGETEVFHNQAHYGVHAIEGGVLWEALPDFPNQASFATCAAIAGKCEALARVLAAHALLYRRLQRPGGWAAYADAWAAALPNFAREEGRSQWQFYQDRCPFAEDLCLPSDGVDFLQKLNIRMGLQPTMLDYDDIVDTGPARDALALIAEAA